MFWLLTYGGAYWFGGLITCAIGMRARWSFLLHEPEISDCWCDGGNIKGHRQRVKAVWDWPFFLLIFVTWPVLLPMAGTKRLLLTLGAGRVRKTALPDAPAKKMPKYLED